MQTDTPQQIAKKPAGRPKETVNARCCGDYVKKTHGMRCSSEVKAYAMTQRSTGEEKGLRMCALLDRAVVEARRDKRKTVTMKDLQRALSFEAHGMQESTPAPVYPRPEPVQPVVAYDLNGRAYSYYPASQRGY